MFGKKKSMVEAQAKILQDVGPAGYTGMVGDPTANIKYIVEVRPANGEPFQVETKAKVELISPPAVGDVLRALYDPESHKVELQLEGDPRYGSKVRKAAADLTGAGVPCGSSSPATEPGCPGARAACPGSVRKYRRP